MTVVTRREYVGGIAASVAMLAGCSGNQASQNSPEGSPTLTSERTTTIRENLDTFYVDASVEDGGSGTRSDPLGSIQSAVELADPGNTIKVGAGEYREKITTVRNGAVDKPIMITGPSEAVLRGSRDDYGIVRIHHSHFHIVGMTIEGLLEPDQPEQLSSYVEGQLIQTRPPLDTDSYLTDIVIAPANIGYSRKSLIGLERTENSKIGPLRVTGLAGADYVVGPENDHNGELLYIGTAPNNLGSDWHPWTEFDETSDVRIHHINNSGGHPHAEAVDLKPGTHDIVVEYVTDRNGGQVTDDATRNALSHNGHDNVVRWCDIGDAPILVEFDADYPDWTHANSLYENRLHGYEDTPIAFEDVDTVGLEDQDVLCGNQIEGVDEGAHYVVSDCPSTVSDGNGIGHTGGESPWTD